MVTEQPAFSIYPAVKRILDIVLSVIGFICIPPFMLIIKTIYLVSGDREPILYTQTRIGLNGKEFKLYKFRSMVNNADHLLKDMLEKPEYKTEWQERQKIENDPRLTKIGKFLRKSSLDELPQLINVLKGDMSLVGPRPLVAGELQKHDGLPLYNTVRPGITGWWACNGRSHADYHERLELEYYYIRHCSFLLDVLCIAKTIAVILRQEGAQ